MTIIGPMLFAGVMVVPVLLASYGSELKTIAVIDEQGLLQDGLKGDEEVSYIPLKISLEEGKAQLDKGNFDGLLYLKDYTLDDQDLEPVLYSKKNLSITLLRDIRKSIEEHITDLRLAKSGLSSDFIETLKPRIEVTTLNIKEGEEKTTNAAVISILGLAGAFLIYFFIFLYGAQVMRGVIEEKTNRIVEVMISSVKPFELMLGKIIGLAGVGLTQFLLWVVLTLVITTIVTTGLGLEMASQPNAPGQEEVMKELPISESSKMIGALFNLNFWSIGFGFIFYFLAGYLLYSSMFAAIGSLADTDTDTQQFMFPVSMPLILGIFISQLAIDEPEGALAFWGSIIPFTSPVVMMVRIPFGVPIWEMALSIVTLIATFLLIVWLSGKIYRTGILMYGKKISIKEIWRWLAY